MTDTVNVPRKMILRLSKRYDLGLEVEAEIEDLRALLAAEPPAVEEVEVEVAGFLMRSDTYGSWLAFFRDQSADVTEPLMTVSQHHRIISRLK